MKWRTNLVLAAVLVGIPGLAFGAGPAIDGAVSYKTHETGEFGLDLLSAVEARAGGVGELEVTFDTAIDPTSVAGNIEIVDEEGTVYTGFTTDLSGAVLTLTLDPALSQHCFTVSFAGLESTTGDVSDASMQFIALEGDVTGDAIVNSIDYSSIKPYYGEDVDVDTFVYDLSVSGPVINTIDSAFVKARFGTAVSCGEFTATHLAGSSLDDYPYFQYVRAHNENTVLEVAIDPTRFPDITGETCDVYVVDAKTEAQWDGDKTLADVTSGVETKTFSGTTIQQNTLQVAAAYGLDADAGIGLGVPYDVVLDCDQNGVLSGGDYIDGYGDEAGIYAVHDTSQAGPLAVTEIIYSGGGWLGEDTYYPTNIGSMGKLPLVVVSHGNGHYYQWYDHIGYHLASYGYIVMAHQNNTSPGSATAAYCTVRNTDYIIGAQATIGGGVLNGHIDSNHITWIGHSRGAEGVVRAHVLVRTGIEVPDHYDVDDIVLVSSIAPVTHISPPSGSTPYDENYHMFIAGADADVTGSPSSGSSKPLAFYERSFGNKQLHYVHGAGHGDFHDGGGSSVASGPDLIGRPTTHKVVKGYYLPLVEYYSYGNIPAKDFLTRMYEGFHPIGIPGNVIIANEYKDAEGLNNFVLDDYQSQTSTTTSSSGGAVSYNVLHLNEVLMQELDGSFAWTGSQPSNGMTMYRSSGDTGRCVVFDWTTSSPRYYEYAVVSGERDFTDDEFISLRACQGTRHPETDALDSPLSFTITLRDGSGTSSSVDFASLGRITRTYKRTGYGAGAGWANEFNTVRVRLTDFLNNGSGLDLTDIAAVRLEFGSAYGSNRGRIGVDDVELTKD